MSASTVHLLVDTGFSAWPLLSALENFGGRVHVVGNNPRDTLARVCADYHELDYSNSSELRKLINYLRPSSVIPGCTDLSYLSCAEATAGLGYHGFDDLKTTKEILNKERFKRVANRLRLPVPRTHEGSELATLNQLKHSVIIKPVDSFSGKGVTVLRSPSAVSVKTAIDFARAESKEGKFLAEEFIEGQLHSHSAFIRDGKVVIDFWVVEYCSVNPFVVDVSFVTDHIPSNIQETFRKDIEKLAQSLDLTDGLLHTQFILNGDKYFIIEMTRRCPGDLYSLLIKMSTGIDYPLAYIQGFLTATLELQIQEHRRSWVMRHTITCGEPTEFQNIAFRQPIQINRWVPLAKVGDHLRPSPLGRLGILFAESVSFSTLQDLTRSTVEGKLYKINGEPFEPPAPF